MAGADDPMEPNTLLVTICGARALYLKSKPVNDVYATVILQGKSSLKSKASTESVPSEGDCRWDEVCEFKLSEKFNALLIAVYTRTKSSGSGDLIGKCEISLDQAKTLQGGVNWFRLRKKSSDEKQRGDVQLDFKFSYEKPSLSVSSMSLNKLEAAGSGGSGKENVLSKMKRKIKNAKGHKQAEDTMSMASGFSVMSTKSTKSGFFDKLLHKKDKTLPAGTFMTPPENHLDASQIQYDSTLSAGNSIASRKSMNRSGIFGMFDNSANGTGPGNHTNSTHFDISVAGGAASQRAADSSSSFLSAHNTSRPSLIARNSSLRQEQSNRFSDGSGAAAMLNRSDSMHRTTSNHSVASSGFESSKILGRNGDATNTTDLLCTIDKLKLELQVKESRIKDMEKYMDNLISRVMERNPELLAAPAAEKSLRRRFF